MAGPERHQSNPPGEAALERIKLEMAAEYEEAGRLDWRRWLEAMPEQAAAILDFGFILECSPRVGDLEESEAWFDEGEVAAHAIATACDEVRDPLAVRERELGAAMAEVRAGNRPPEGKGGARPPFKRAAVNAWLVDQIRGERPGASRIAAVKGTYLLERSLGLGLFTDHQRMPFGPYDPTTKYRDAEPIAIKQGWLVRSGHDLMAGPEMSGVYRFAPRYLRDPELASRLAGLLAGRSPWELETWATVEAIASDLRASGEATTATSVCRALSTSPTWKTKLQRPNFTRARIEDALVHLRRLQLIGP